MGWCALIQKAAREFHRGLQRRISADWRLFSGRRQFFRTLAGPPTSRLGCLLLDYPSDPPWFNERSTIRSGTMVTCLQIKSTKEKTPPSAFAFGGEVLGEHSLICTLCRTSSFWPEAKIHLTGLFCTGLKPLSTIAVAVCTRFPEDWLDADVLGQII